MSETPGDIALIQAAREVVGEFKLRADFNAGAVAAALRTSAGNVHTGICLDFACGAGFCAEVSAIAGMLKTRETHIVSIVAILEDGTVLPPCGRCRETLAQVDARNLQCRVLLPSGRSAPLKELLPEHWLETLGL